MMKEGRVFEGEDYETVDMETEIMGVGELPHLRSRSYGRPGLGFPGGAGADTYEPKQSEF